MNKKNWLSENIASVIAISFLMNTFCIFYLVLLKQVKTSDSTTITIIQTISNILMLIVGFYFGSSKSGKDKDTQINNLMQKPGIENIEKVNINTNESKSE